MNEQERGTTTAEQAAVDDVFRRNRWWRIRAGLAGLLFGVGFAMLGGLITYGVQHHATAVVIQSSFALAALFGYWVLEKWPWRS